MNIFVCLEHIPDFDDIPKTSDTFWKKTTMEKLRYGEHFGKQKVKVYKQSGSSFILCQEKNGWEWIHNIREDGLLADGIYRFRAHGSTIIGSQYFERSGRGEYRYLQRYNDSGNIDYCDLNDFNPETLVWTKIQYLVLNKHH